MDFALISFFPSLHFKDSVMDTLRSGSFQKQAKKGLKVVSIIGTGKRTIILHRTQNGQIIPFDVFDDDDICIKEMSNIYRMIILGNSSSYLSPSQIQKLSFLVLIFLIIWNRRDNFNFKQSNSTQYPTAHTNSEKT